MNFIKKLFVKYWKINSKEANTVDWSTKSNDEIVKFLLSCIMSHEYLSVPIYIQGMDCEEQSEFFGTHYPLQYAWNESQTDDGHLLFSFSVNGAAVSSVLEKIIPRVSPNFAVIRDEAMNLLCNLGKVSLVNMAEKYFLPPSKLLTNFEYKDMINPNASTI